MPPRRAARRPQPRQPPTPSLRNDTQLGAVAAAELRYIEVKHATALLHAEERGRQLRLSTLLLRNEMDDMNEKLCDEMRRREGTEIEAEAWQTRAEACAENLGRVESELKARVREVDVMNAELSSHQSASADTQKLLTEKLALARDVANMRPEVEHLRAQASSNESVLSEKLSLQRQLDTTKAQLEDTDKALGLANEESKTSQELTARVDTLEREIGKAHKELQNAQVKLDDSDEQNRAHEEMTKELEEVKQQLKIEQKERKRAEKESEKQRTETQAQQAVLEDKLNQFRTKLKSTKDRLKETEAELAHAREETAAASSRLAKQPATRNPRKRPASQQDPDAAIGTPGDAHANKRNKRASSVAVGEKSTFSVTPFLNRTASMSVAPEEQRQRDRPIASIEVMQEEQENDTAEPSPTARQLTNKKEKRSHLVPASSAKSNLKVNSAHEPAGAKRPRNRAAKAAAVPTTLENVVEEDENGGEITSNVPDPSEDSEKTTAGTTAPDHTKAAAPKPKPRLKPPKRSLSSFASFRDASLPPQRQPSLGPSLEQNQNRKKRKLPGGAARTIFDEEEGEDAEDDGSVAPRSRLGSVGAFGGAGAGKQRAFGALSGGFSSFGGLGGGLLSRKKGPLVVNGADGFAFSPLKKERRAMRAASEAAPADGA